MGTDIHPVVERFVDGRWCRVIVPADLRDALESRSYLKFAALANVRNGFGFAGTPTHEPIEPISEPKGLPDVRDPDAGLGVEDDSIPWLGDHSFTWVSARELQAYDWRQTLTRTGVIPLADFKAWTGLEPREWSGAISGRNSITIDMEDAQDLEPPPGLRIYVRVHWRTTLVEAIGPFVTDFLPWLYSLGKPDEVRIVMGFDS